MVRTAYALLSAAALISVPATTEPSPEPEWRIAELRGIEVDGEISSLSPDGKWIAGIGPENTLCLWDAETLSPQCDDTPLRISRQIPLPTMAWAPDSSAVAFDLSALVEAVDSDVYVFDVATAELANLTDDGYEGSSFDDAPVGTPVDIVPAWSPDGSQLAFVRSSFGDEPRSTTIMRIDRSGGDPVEVHRLDVAEPFAVWTPMHWLADDTIIYAQTSSDVEEPTNGIWRLPLDGGTPVRLKLGDVDEPGLVVGAARGDYLSVLSLPLVTQSTDPAMTKFWIAGLDGSTVPVLNVDPATGAPVTPDEIADDPGDVMTLAWPITPVGLSPDGEAGLVAYRDGDELAFSHVDPSTGDLGPLEFRVPFVPTDPTPPQWAANDVALLRGPPGNALLLTLEET